MTEVLVNMFLINMFTIIKIFDWTIIGETHWDSSNGCIGSKLGSGLKKGLDLAKLRKTEIIS